MSEGVVVEAFDRDLRKGDIIEPDLGLFVRVSESTEAGNEVCGNVAMVVPAKKGFKTDREWAEEVDNRCLDMILDSKNEREKKVAIATMKYVKENYG